MTTEQQRDVRELAGAELDERVAVEIMGETLIYEGGLMWKAVPIGHYMLFSDAYSSSVSASWQVVERMRAAGWSVCLADEQPGKPHPEGRPAWRCTFIPPDRLAVDMADGWGDTAPEAVCRAALAAVRGEVRG